MKVSTLKPGLLVSLKTSITGNVHYVKNTIEPDHTNDEGVRVAVWETERRIADPAEHEKARQVRGKVCGLIRKICIQSAFGMLCPEKRAKELAAAMKQANKMTDDFNAKASITRVSVYLLAGRIAANDIDAVRAINSEVRDLFEEMERGVKNLDAKTIRAAANRVKGIGKMLTDDASSKITEAIKVARETAKSIVKAGEQAAQEVDREAIKFLSSARTAFLDVDAEAVSVSNPGAVGRSIDLSPVVSKSKSKSNGAVARSIDTTPVKSKSKSKSKSKRELVDAV